MFAPPSPFVGLAHGAVDEPQIGNGWMPLDDLGVDDREKHDPHTVWGLGAEDDLHIDDRARRSRRDARCEAPFGPGQESWTTSTNR